MSSEIFENKGPGYVLCSASYCKCGEPENVKVGGWVTPTVCRKVVGKVMEGCAGFKVENAVAPAVGRGILR